MIVIITPPHTLPDEECIVNKLFESGLHLLHLRKPGADRETLERYIRGIRPRFRERVILHDHFELAEVRVKRDSLEIQRGTDVHRAGSTRTRERVVSLLRGDRTPRLSSRTTSFSARYLTVSPNPDTRRLSPRSP